MNIKINYKDMSFLKLVFKKSLPLIIGSIIIAITNLIDNFMIGQLQQMNSHELSASSLSQKYINIVMIFINAIIAMFSFLIFQYKGSKNYQKIKETIKIILYFVIILNIIGILIGFFLVNDVMKFFQGNNYNKYNSSTAQGIAQSYMKVLIFTLIPTSFLQVYINIINAFGKQKVIMIATIVSLVINVLFNYVFYKVLSQGLNGIAYSTILGNCFSLLVVIIFIFKYKLQKIILFNINEIFKLDLIVFKIGIKRFGMGLQTILWSGILISIQIIYSNWYGDIANERLAIIMPVTSLFYTGLNGIAATKGYFIGIEIGKGNKKQALINDKRINLYSFIFCCIDGFMLIILAYPIPLIWKTVSIEIHYDVTIILIAVGATYPIAALTKTLLNSLKIGGLGKEVIISNGIFAFFLELMIPLILFVIHNNSDFNLPFWSVFVISRIVKLFKLGPTLYFWKKQNWLNKAFKD